MYSDNDSPMKGGDDYDPYNDPNHMDDSPGDED